MNKTLPKILLGLAICGVLVSCNKGKNKNSSTSLPSSVVSSSSLNNSTSSNLPSSSSSSIPATNSSTSTTTSSSSTVIPLPTKVNVTFSVTLPGALNSWERLFVYMGFDSNWSTQANYELVTKVDDTHYTLTQELAIGEIYYKYVLTGLDGVNTWDYEENRDFGNDRSYAISTQTHSLTDTVESWKARPANPNPDPVKVNVTFAVTLPSALNSWEKLYIYGGLDSQWLTPFNYEITDKVDDTHYTLTREMFTGEIYYKFVLTGLDGVNNWSYEENRDFGNDRHYNITLEAHAPNDTVESWKARPANPNPVNVNVNFTVTLPSALNSWERLFVYMGFDSNWTTQANYELVTKVDDTHYTLTQELAIGEIYYKFVLTGLDGVNNWAYEENRDYGNNRHYSITAEAHAPVDIVEGWKARPANPNPDPDPDPVKVDVTFSVTLPDALNSWERLFIYGGLDSQWTSTFEYEVTTKVDDTHYTVTKEMNTGDIYYKYVLTGLDGVKTWDYVENTDQGNNRHYAIKADAHTPTDTVESWKAHPANPNPNPDPEPAKVNVTFTVTLPDALNSWERLFVYMGFDSNWTTQANYELVTKVDDTHYTLTQELAIGDIYYKYVLTGLDGVNNWAYEENRDYGNNRHYAIKADAHTPTDTVESWKAHPDQPV